MGLVGLIVLLIFSVWYFNPDYKGNLATYYIWRVGKTNSTAIDQVRSRQRLLELMVDQRVAAEATRKLAELLRRPGLPMDRVDLTLQVLLESRTRSSDNFTLLPLLVDSLRASSVDARARINDALKFFTPSCATKLDEDIDRWQPNEGDSTVLLEKRIAVWSEYWRVCSQKNS